MNTLIVSTEALLTNKERARQIAQLQPRKGRECASASCTNTLSIYNTDKQCFPCLDKQLTRWCEGKTEPKKPIGSPSALINVSPMYEKAVKVMKTYCAKPGQKAPEITSDAITAALGVSHRSASRYLSTACTRGVMELVKSDRNGLATYRVRA